MKPANFAPAYAALYPQLAEIARQHGYAMAVHGSMGRDFDVVCIPWIEEAGEPQAVVDAITKRFAIEQVHGWDVREHGREVTTLSIGFGECFVDLSFMARNPGAGLVKGDKARGDMKRLRKVLTALSAEATAEIGLFPLASDGEDDEIREYVDAMKPTRASRTPRAYYPAHVTEPCGDCDPQTGCTMNCGPSAKK